MPKRLGPAVRTFRESRGWTQRQLIEAVVDSGGKLSSGHLAEIESGNRGASRDKVDELALAMGLNEEEHMALLMAAGHSPDGAAAMVNLHQRLTQLEKTVRDLQTLMQRLEDKIPGGP